MSHTLRLLVLAAAGVLLAGCASSSPKSMSTPVPATTANLAPLREADLKLARLVADGQTITVPAERPPALQFLADGGVAGFAGVNRFNGAFTLGPEGTLTWGPGLAATRMAGPPERMALENAFMKALPATTRLGVLPYGVVFQSEDGKNVVELVK
ncbi:MAG TPA: META domain-containing protein [Verrucomicrobiota bacterium]|nr:META domain-containing protein [Verrucomicrobiota bacterium]